LLLFEALRGQRQGAGAFCPGGVSRGAEHERPVMVLLLSGPTPRCADWVGCREVRALPSASQREGRSSDELPRHHCRSALRHVLKWSVGPTSEWIITSSRWGSRPTGLGRRQGPPEPEAHEPDQRARKLSRRPTGQQDHEQQPPRQVWLQAGDARRRRWAINIIANQSQSTRVAGER